MTLNVRDFIYMDVERLKSIIAQLERGLPGARSDATTTSREVDASISAGLMKFLEASGGAQFLWQKQQTETRTLHDNIYIRVEQLLLEGGLLVSIPRDIDQDQLELGLQNELIPETAFILATGKVAINDFGTMRAMFEKFNELGKFIALASAESLPEALPKQERRKFVQDQQTKLKLDPKMLDGFKLVFDMFYKDRIVVKMTPHLDFPDFRLVGNLRAEYLRDNISSITYKYGTAPVSPWKMFAQVASIPPKDRKQEDVSISGGDIDVAMHNMFDAVRGLEKMVQSVDYPEIAVTPIALYRE